VNVPRGTPEVDSEMFHVEHSEQGTSQDALHTRRLSRTLCVPLRPLWSERLNQTTEGAEGRGIKFFHVSS
jgi:hypothetical protein